MQAGIELAQDLFDLGFHLRVDNANLVNKRPVTLLVDQELGLLSTLTVHVDGIIRPVLLIDHVPINLVELLQVIVPICKSGNPVAV